MPNVKSCLQLLLEFAGQPPLPQGEILKFAQVGEKTVYNITAPFEVGGKIYLAGRVESLESDCQKPNYDAATIFFTEVNGVWTPVEEAPVLKMEDPAVTRINGELIVAGVEVFRKADGNMSARTIFYRGGNLRDLKRFAQGPDGTKGIRLIQLPDGTIGAFTRPENEVADLWVKEIGFTKLASLAELNAQNLSRAKVISGQLAHGEWGGTNEIHLLENGLLGVLGHVAYRDEKGNRRYGNQHYYAMAFTFDPEKREASPLKIIATRQNFPQGEMEQGHTKAHVKDVLFPGGLIRNKSNGTAVLYTGISDTMAGRDVIPDPFPDP